MSAHLGPCPPSRALEENLTLSVRQWPHLQKSQPCLMMSGHVNQGLCAAYLAPGLSQSES